MAPTLYSKMDPNRLWAKSKRDDEEQVSSMLLPGHLQDVFAAACQLQSCPPMTSTMAIGLNAGDYRDRFHRCILLAAAVHDLSKANDHFRGYPLRTATAKTDNREFVMSGSQS